MGRDSGWMAARLCWCARWKWRRGKFHLEGHKDGIFIFFRVKESATITTFHSDQDLRRCRAALFIVLYIHSDTFQNSRFYFSIQYSSPENSLIYSAPWNSRPGNRERRNKAKIFRGIPLGWFLRREFSSRAWKSLIMDGTTEMWEWLG